MIKSILIFMIQAFVVSCITALICSELYLYYKQELEEKPTIEMPDCPIVSCPRCEEPTSYIEEERLACIGKNLYVISGERLLLKSKNDQEILCFESDEIQSLTGYNLFERVK